MQLTLVPSTPTLTFLSRLFFFFTLARPDSGDFLLPWLHLPFSHLLILKAWLPSPFLISSKTSISSASISLGMPTGAEPRPGNYYTSDIAFFGSVPECIQRNNCDSQQIWNGLISYNSAECHLSRGNLPFRKRDSKSLWVTPSTLKLRRNLLY